jgi:hypothetical protein
MKNKNFETFLGYLALLSAKILIVGLVLLVFSAGLIFNEVRGAKNFCESVNKTYLLTKFLNFMRYITDKDSKFVRRLFIINTHKGYNRMKKVLQALAVLAPQSSRRNPLPGQYRQAWMALRSSR